MGSTASAACQTFPCPAAPRPRRKLVGLAQKLRPIFFGVHPAARRALSLDHLVIEPTAYYAKLFDNGSMLQFLPALLLLTLDSDISSINHNDPFTKASGILGRLELAVIGTSVINRFVGIVCHKLRLVQHHDERCDVGA
mmetsp:Transcript_98943/g.206221  ORF Transcript_98943/g.206221 Transcript_98943/m.206221 type:complete len:139 (-) Transcript_98943:195-611(-)